MTEQQMRDAEQHKKNALEHKQRGEQELANEENKSARRLIIMDFLGYNRWEDVPLSSRGRSND